MQPLACYTLKPWQPAEKQFTQFNEFNVLYCKKPSSAKNVYPLT